MRRDVEIKMKYFKKVIFVIIIALVTTLIKWFPASVYLIMNSDNTPSFLGKEKYYEAKQWLAENKNQNAFASNRFLGTANAVRFVDSLYDAGAEKVYVLEPQEDADTIRDEGGPYGDTLVVIMPSDFWKRNRILKIKGKEAIFDPTAINGNELFFWWD